MNENTSLVVNPNSSPSSRDGGGGSEETGRVTDEALVAAGVEVEDGCSGGGWVVNEKAALGAKLMSSPSLEVSHGEGQCCGWFGSLIWERWGGEGHAAGAAGGLGVSHRERERERGSGVSESEATNN